MRSLGIRWMSGCLLVLAMLGPGTVRSETYELKQMTPDVQAALNARQQRFSQLAAAKQAGTVGETNEGLVTPRGGGPEAAALAEAENRDRLTIYQAIVAQNGLPADALATVQRVFAEVQREKAAAGDPIQLPSGEWSRK